MKQEIRRFPRLRKDYPNAPLSKTQKLQMRIAEEEKLPRNYNRLSKKQKQLIRLVINGTTIHDACKKKSVSQNSWFRWMHSHKLFRLYYLGYAKKAALHIDTRLDAKVGRAVRVIEDSLDSDDPYFAHEVANKFLTGRGIYRKSVDSKNEISGLVKVGGSIQSGNGIVMDKDTALLFVNALVGMSKSNKPIPPRVIDAQVVKQLPEPVVNDIDTEVEKAKEQRETA